MFCNRATLNFTQISGLAQDLAINETQSQWVFSIFYFCVVMDLPSNIILRRWHPSFWLGIIMSGWGICSVSLAACTDFNGLVIAQFFKSLFEAVFLPGMVYYLSLWYTRREFGKRIGIIWSCRCLAGALGSLFAYGLSTLDSGSMRVWQWTCIIQGTPCVILDVETYNIYDWSWDQVGSVFMDGKTYGFTLLYFLNNACLQGTLSLLQVIADHLNAKNPLKTHSLMIPPYILAICFTLSLSYSSDKFNDRGLHLFGINSISLCLLLVVIFISKDYMIVIYVATCFIVALVNASTSIKLAWVANSFVGRTRRAVAIASIFAVGTIGGAVGDQIIASKQSISRGSMLLIVLLVLQILSTLLMHYCLRRENKRRSRLNSDRRDYHLYKFSGIELVGDRHPDFRYIT
ncbi:MFS general substrate transporter [Backusella circina FSU 941]|nr:MFS general substrate transporter [Backusella circina FSU 941]